MLPFIIKNKTYNYKIYGRKEKLIITGMQFNMLFYILFIIVFILNIYLFNFAWKYIMWHYIIAYTIILQTCFATQTLNKNCSFLFAPLVWIQTKFKPWSLDKRNILTNLVILKPLSILDYCKFNIMVLRAGFIKEV